MARIQRGQTERIVVVRVGFGVGSEQRPERNVDGWGP
jgi:hypothetical protein